MDMSLRATALLVVGITLVPAQAQQMKRSPLSSIEQKMCQETKCQRDLRVTLKDKTGKNYDRTFEVFPAIVHSFGFTVAAGQTVHIEADDTGETLSNLVAVDIVTRPEKTITTTLEQLDNGGMLLVVNNPFRKELKFNMAVMPLDKEDVYKTSSCPIVPGGKIFEKWPYPIFQIVLANGRFLKDSNEFSCVE